MHHPHSYLAVQQIAEDRRRDLELAAKGARSRALARPPRRRAWRRVVSTARRLVSQPAT